MAFKTKLQIAGIAFLSLLLFTVPGREVLAEVLGTALVLGICGVLTIFAMFVYKEIEQRIKKRKNYSQGNVYKNKQ